MTAVLDTSVFAVDEADGSPTGPDCTEWQVGCAPAPRAPAAPRLRSQRRPARHQEARRRVRQPQGAGGELPFFSLKPLLTYLGTS